MQDDVTTAIINVVWKREIINLCDVDEKMEPISK